MSPKYSNHPVIVLMDQSMIPLIKLKKNLFHKLKTQFKATNNHLGGQRLNHIFQHNVGQHFLFSNFCVTKTSLLNPKSSRCPKKKKTHLLRFRTIGCGWSCDRCVEGSRCALGLGGEAFCNNRGGEFNGLYVEGVEVQTSPWVKYRSLKDDSLYLTGGIYISSTHFSIYLPSSDI